MDRKNVELWWLFIGRKILIDETGTQKLYDSDSNDSPLAKNRKAIASFTLARRALHNFASLFWIRGATKFKSSLNFKFL